jgi:hypothetical protein
MNQLFATCTPSITAPTHGWLKLLGHLSPQACLDPAGSQLMGLQGGQGVKYSGAGC